MKNVDMVVEGDILTINVDLSHRFGKSSSGNQLLLPAQKNMGTGMLFQERRGDKID